MRIAVAFARVVMFVFFGGFGRVGGIIDSVIGDFSGDGSRH